MNFKEIQELLKLVNKLNLTEFKMKDGEFELSIRTKNYEKGGKQQTTLVSSPAQQVIPVSPVQQSFAPPANPPVAPALKPAVADLPPTPAATPEANNYLEIKSPIVGTFYRSSSPDKPAYVKVGDTVEAGQVVCIVEAMKLFNEIESEVSGKIVKILVDDSSPVEFDQPLFLVDPS